MDRLIEAVLALWETEGNGGTSARSLSRLAEAPVSSIYHHFGNLEQLFLSTHEAAQRRAEQWCAVRLADLAQGDGFTPAAFPMLMAALIDQWCEEQRRLAFAWRECQLMAAREPRYLPVARRWTAMWEGFWEDICARCGHAGRGAFTSYLFDGESALHLMRWRRPVDRAGLDEMCAGWNDWLCGRPARDGDWRRFARAQADAAMPDLTIASGTMEQIAQAAADILAELGMAGLTHRAVAARAGLTLGVVSYNFRSSAELARAAFEMVYRKAVQITGGTIDDPAALSQEEVMARYRNYQPEDRTLSALDELLLAASRDAQLQTFAPQLRYQRGRTSGGLLRAMLGSDRPVSNLETALFSGFASGHRKACLGLERAAASAHGAATMTALCDLLRPPAES